MANFNFNKVILGGRLTQDVELKQTPNGVSVAQFSMAVNRKGSKDQVDFINCVAWRNNAEFITKYFKKGSSICVTGTLQTRTWTDNNGQKRYATEVLAEETNFVDSKNDNEHTPSTEAQVGFATAPNFEDVASDEDLPF